MDILPLTPVIEILQLRMCRNSPLTCSSKGGVDVGEGQLKFLECVLSGSCIDQSGPLRPPPSGEGQSQLFHSCDRGGARFPSLMERLFYDIQAQAAADGNVAFVVLVHVESVLVLIFCVISGTHTNYVFNPVLNYKDPSELAPPFVGEPRESCDLLAGELIPPLARPVTPVTLAQGSCPHASHQLLLTNV